MPAIEVAIISMTIFPLGIISFVRLVTTNSSLTCTADFSDLTSYFTISTGHFECWDTPLATLPSNSFLKPPSPREPITMKSI